MTPLRTLPAALLLGLLTTLPAAAQNPAAQRPDASPADHVAPALDDATLFVLEGDPVDLTPTPEEMAALLAMTVAPEAAVVAIGAPEQPLAAYPNPSAGRAAVRFELAETASVRLAVYDLLGREVAVLVDGAVGAGTHEAVFDGSRLASGLYLVRLETAGAVQTQRLTLQR